MLVVWMWKNICPWVWCMKNSNKYKMTLFNEQRQKLLISVMHGDNQRRWGAMIQEYQWINQRCYEARHSSRKSAVYHWDIELQEVYARCIRWHLMDAMKEQWKNVCQELFIIWEWHFLKHITTAVEYCVQHYNLKNKNQSIECCHSDSLRVRKFKRVPSV